MLDGLLKTKLFAPPHRSNHLLRNSLNTKLKNAQQTDIPFLLVSAPAGFGKTTLIADWVRSNSIPFAWITLDQSDNNLQQFWRYMNAALQEIDDRIGENLKPALYSAQAPVIQQIVSGMINDIIDCGKQFILVLEDYHLIENIEIHESLNFLLDQRTPQMQLIITTRSDPPLNLARRRAQGQLFEIRANDLSFSSEEIAEFLNQTMRLNLDDHDISALVERTEGWIAGLQMVALSLQDESDRHAFVSEFSGNFQYIVDYLMEEVFQRQPKDFQIFLLRTSILDRLNASLCDAVASREDSRAMLNMLDKANLFLFQLDNQREWFRYHHLFSEFLRKSMYEIYRSDEIAALHQKALGWYESQGDISNALIHAGAISDHARFLDLLEKNAKDFYNSSALPLFYKYANLIPIELRRTSPYLCAAVAWAGLATGQSTGVDEWLTAAESHFNVVAESILGKKEIVTSDQLALLEVLVIRMQFPSSLPITDRRAQLLSIQDQLLRLPEDQIVMFSSALDLNAVIAFDLGQLAEEEGNLAIAAEKLADATSIARRTHNSSLFHLAAGHLANILFIQGKLGAACRTHEEALAEAIHLGQKISPYVALSHAGIGTINLEQNDINAAEFHFNEGFANARIWNQWESLVLLTLGLARLKLRTEGKSSALRILGELGAPPYKGGDLQIKAFSARLQDRESAQLWLNHEFPNALPEPDPTNEIYLLDIARLLAVLNRKVEALEVIKKIIQYSRESGRNLILIRAKISEAILKESPDSLMDALHLAESEEIYSPFIEEGEPIQNMISLLVNKSLLDSGSINFCQKVLTAFNPDSQKPNTIAGMIEPLSKRELEVLKYMADALSNPEIASRLFLSPNTLKAHAQNIFMKLDVHSRMQAVSKAKELGLIE